MLTSVSFPSFPDHSIYLSQPIDRLKSPMASVIPLPRSLTTPGGAYFLPPNLQVTRQELERRDANWRRMREIGHARARLRLESAPSSSQRPTTSSGPVRIEDILNDPSIYQSPQRQRTWDDDATLVGTTRGVRLNRERLLMEQVREMEREEERERQRRRDLGGLSPPSHGTPGQGIWRRWWRRD